MPMFRAVIDPFNDSRSIWMHEYKVRNFIREGQHKAKFLGALYHKISIQMIDNLSNRESKKNMLLAYGNSWRHLRTLDITTICLLSRKSLDEFGFVYVRFPMKSPRFWLRSETGFNVFECGMKICWIDLEIFTLGIGTDNCRDETSVDCKNGGGTAGIILTERPFFSRPSWLVIIELFPSCKPPMGEDLEDIKEEQIRLFMMLWIAI
ncbi:hypothetical protein B0H34DRAFT_680064 [Crassisporium funariophilum]|nr:hypothetical protein B0H34DRAFT_680064 [Crassisporium funariophilum]